MKTLLFFFIVSVIACNEPNASPKENRDTMPVLKPDTLDTSSVVSLPPTGDSNVVHPDSSVKSK